MAYNALNNLIDAYIYANGVQAITGQILNGVLKQMVSQLGSGYHLMGVAVPATEPAANDYAMAYFAATAGEYTDFGGITLAAGEVAVLLTSGNGSWSKETIYNVPTGTADLENTANFITNAVTDLVNYYTKTEVDDTLANYPTLEALATALADYYTKQEIDTTLEDYPTKQDQETALGDYYTKDEMDAALGDRYTKSETDTKLEDYYKKTETYDKDEVDSIVAALSRQEYIVAWDGLAAPDVSAIPAGVTVTYSGTTYTGTLAASASTVNKIYMVWNGTAYDMYGTSQDGGYSWVPMGTTTVDLSQYATKSEVSQLEAQVADVERGLSDEIGITTPILENTMKLVKTITDFPVSSAYMAFALQAGVKYFIVISVDTAFHATLLRGMTGASDPNPDDIFNTARDFQVGEKYTFIYTPSHDVSYLRLYGSPTTTLLNVSVYQAMSIYDYAEPILLEYKGSRALTRASCPVRAKGVCISYVENGKLIVEKFTGDDTSNLYWNDPSDNNRLWYSVSEDDRFESGVSTDLYSRGVSFDSIKIYGNVESLSFYQVVKAFIGNNNYYLSYTINGVNGYALVPHGSSNTIRITADDVSYVVIVEITLPETLGTLNIFKTCSEVFINSVNKEDIIPANTEMCPASIKSSGNFSTNFEVGVFLACSRYGVSIQTYDGTSALRLEKLIPLYGGVKYVVNNVFNTASIADFLYDKNGNIIDAYSVARANATRQDASILYYIDLTNYRGVYYLRLSQKANSGSLSLITIKNLSDIDKGQQEPFVGVITDGLKSGKSQSISIESGLYGEDGAVYSFPVKHSNYRISFNFKVNRNVNISGTDIPFAVFDGTAPNPVSLKCANPEPLYQAYGVDNSAYQQDLMFNSGFVVNGVTKIRQSKFSKPIVGVPAFYVWLKGAEDFTLPSDETLYARQQWLTEHSDYAISLANDVLSIVRYNISTGVVTEILDSFSLKSGNDWKSLQTLYAEIKSSLSDFSILMGDLTSNKNCGELLQFGVVPLVGYYNQKLRSTDELAYCYDSFPVPIRFSQDETEHTCEILQVNGRCVVSIDGESTPCIQTLPWKFIIGNDGVTIYNLVAKFGELGEDFFILGDTSHPRLVSDVTPRLIGVMGHNIYDVSEETGVTNPGINNSVTRVEDVCKRIKEQGYQSFSLDELIEVVRNNLKGVRKGIFIIYDDIPIPMIYLDKSIHSKISKYGIQMNSALIHTAIGEYAPQILPMRLIGWGCGSHTIAHDVPVPRKNSRTAFWELHEIKTQCDQYYMTPDILIFPYQGQWVNSYNMLQLCGYMYAVNSGGDENWQYTNPYNLGRLNMADSTPFDEIKAIIS